jgi:hypothetical protein
MTYEIIIEEQYFLLDWTPQFKFYIPCMFLYVKYVCVLYLYKNNCHNFLTNQWENFFFPSDNDYSVQLWTGKNIGSRGRIGGGGRGVK